MRGRLALFAEVVWCGNDSLSEMIQPDSIHHHAGGEWIFRIGDPIGQLATAVAFGVGGKFAAVQDGRRHRRLETTVSPQAFQE